MEGLMNHGPAAGEPAGTKPMRPDFEEKLQAYFQGCQRIAREGGVEAQWRIDRLQSRVPRVRIVSDTSAHSFVDIETGEVLKPAGYDRPALTKIKRGNIFDEHNGLENIGPYGVANAPELRDAKRGVKFISASGEAGTSI
jgi:hypothetical protein